MSRTSSPLPGIRPRRRTILGGLAAGAAVGSTLGLSACGGGNASSTEGELRILVLKHPLTKPMTEMAWTKTLEEAAGVPIVWEEVSADWDQKKSTMLAAGDVPDLIVGTQAITDTDLATYGTLFEDLADDLDAIPNVKAMLEAKPELRALATQAGGEIYSVPGYKRFWPPTVQHQYINRQWLDTLGLEVPTTWDELFDVLVAFKEGDPTGTGAAIVPMDWSPVDTGGFGYFQSILLLGSTGLPLGGGGGQGYFLQDGTVGNFLMDERYREVVSFLARCQEAGLLSGDVMTQDYSAYQSVARGPGDGVATVGFTWGWTRSDRFGPEIFEQYEAIGVLQASQDQSEPVTWSFDQYGENFPGNQVALSASSRNKEAALAVINAFYDQEMSIQVLFGDIGPNIEKTGEMSYKVLPRRGRHRPVDLEVDLHARRQRPDVDPRRDRGRTADRSAGGDRRVRPPAAGHRQHDPRGGRVPGAVHQDVQGGPQRDDAGEHHADEHGDDEVRRVGHQRRDRRAVGLVRRHHPGVRRRPEHRDDAEVLRRLHRRELVMATSIPTGRHPS
ncbi:extracellular solute-binding protein [Brachybacterium sp. UNK5269]|uniref:extracellular solute-binding protein n=1 Tax=Brachybacterium sp. UNK5269 TaxID=3408576 RepID=UPI003BAFCE74